MLNYCKIKIIKLYPVSLGSSSWLILHRYIDYSCYYTEWL